MNVLNEVHTTVVAIIGILLVLSGQVLVPLSQSNITPSGPSSYTGPTVGIASSLVAHGSGVDHVQWTLCLWNNVLLSGNSGSCPNSHGIAPEGVTVDSSNGDLYVADSGAFAVNVVSGATNKVVANISLGAPPVGLDFDTWNGDVYVANGNSVSVISGVTNTVVATTSVSYPTRVAFDSSNGDVYVTSYGSNNVSVISGTTNTVVKTIPVPTGSGPLGVAFDSTNGDIYVADEGPNMVSVISGASNTIVDTISAGDEPYGVGFDSANGDIYVTNAVAPIVSVISGDSNTVVATISVPSLYGLASDSTNGDMYVPGDYSSNVSVISGVTNKVVATVPVGLDPSGAAFDSTSGYMYVTDAGSDALSIIAPSTPPPTYNVSFVETGLPSGMSWGVALNGLLNSSSTNTVAFTQQNGTYSYTVNSPSGYDASPTSGSVSVSGSVPSPVSVIFTKAPSPMTYTVTFTEIGLPTGTSWSLTLNGSLQSSTIATITFQEANGSYSYSTGAVSGYTVSSSSGTIKVGGQSVSQDITFTSSSSKTNQTTTFLGLPGDDAYILIGVIMVVVAAVLAVILMRKRKGARPAQQPYPTQPQNWQQTPTQAPSPGYPQQGWQQPPPPAGLSQPPQNRSKPWVFWSIMNHP